MNKFKKTCVNEDYAPLKQEAKNTTKLHTPIHQDEGPKESIAKPEDIAETITLVLRMMFAAIFSVILALFGYSLGSTVWSGIGFLLALFLFPIGAIYGFFMVEINSFIRSFLIFTITILTYLLKLFSPL